MILPRTKQHAQNRKGFALIGVLWLILLVSLLATSLIFLSKSDGQIAQSAGAFAQAEGWADAGIFLTIRDLSDSQRARNIPVDGTVRSIPIQESNVSVSVQDEAGKIDINFAPKELLQGVFISNGVSQTKGTELAEHIDKERKDIGSSIAFQRVEELKRVRGITPEIYKLVAPLLTVYAQSAEVVASVAPEEVLGALPTMDKASVEAALSKRRLAAQTTNGFVSNRSDFSESKGMAGRVYSITSTGSEGDISFSRRIVIRMTGNDKHPFDVLDFSSVTEDVN